MAETLVFEGQPRVAKGSRGARNLRKKNLLPAILYGHKEDAVALSLPLDEFAKAIRHGVRVVDLKTGGGMQKALIREVQWDHLGKELLHVDFARISEDERVVVSVPVELRGTAPGVSGGGALDQPMHTIAVECLAIRVPESIRVNINDLKLGEAIHVRELVLPEGVKAMADADAIVVQVTQKQLEPEAAAPVVAAEPAEPEVIGRKVAEEEESE